ARAAPARARADHRAPGGTVLLLRGAPREPRRPDAGRGPLHPVVALPRRRPREPGRRARALQRAEERLPRRGGARRPLARADALGIARGRRARPLGRRDRLVTPSRADARRCAGALPPPAGRRAPLAAGPGVPRG